ncbi:MAG: DUF192 domain-containing protein [Actinobacteria bacterium]|nr:DUF192 domain-containing protein [Actinomycetota bacterium]
MACLSIAFILTGIACGGSSEGPEPNRELPPGSPTFGHGRALIDTRDDSVLLDVEIAQTDEQRAFGLMKRERLAEDSGMVFLFFEEHSGGFWMKDTLIPLSIAFFDIDGDIVRILDMEPCEADPCEIYDPGTGYYGALEVNQGAFDDWGVQEGDHIEITQTDPTE